MILYSLSKIVSTVMHLKKKNCPFNDVSHYFLYVATQIIQKNLNK